MSPPAAQVGDLRINLAGTGLDIVDQVSFRIEEGEVLGLVGESGSGKTTIGLALLGHCRRGARIAAGSIMIDGQDVLRMDPAALRRMRGRLVAYIPQDPAAALNPALRIGTQLEEVLAAHMSDYTAAQRGKRLDEMLAEVKLPQGHEFLRRYPHQLSGGQQQRVAVAMAFACRPRVIVLDEPTTGLDVTTQAHVLDTIRTLCRQHGVGALYISHDLAVVAAIAHRVAVMYAGRIVEAGPSDTLFYAPRHPYTRRLIASIPDVSGRRRLIGIGGNAPMPGGRPEGCFFAPRCDSATEECRRSFPPPTLLGTLHEVRCWHADLTEVRPRAERIGPLDGAGSDRPAANRVLSVRGVRAWYQARQVLHDVNIEIETKQCVALVGESGSGKTTLARCVSGIHREYRGEIRLRGDLLQAGARNRPRQSRQTIQYIFQSPYASLNPRKTIGQIVTRPLRLFFELDDAEARGKVMQYLERVALNPMLIDRYPDQLSGGERQRVAIARALAAAPTLLVCDEITSALDVSVQASIVELLANLQRELDLSLLFVTHNLALIRTIADSVVVMSEGRVVETGRVEDVFVSPRSDYTRQLLANTPSLKTAVALARA